MSVSVIANASTSQLLNINPHNHEVMKKLIKMMKKLIKKKKPVKKMKGFGEINKNGIIKLFVPESEKQPVDKDKLTKAQLDSIDKNQWDNAESMYWLRKGKEHNSKIFKACNVNASYDILDDVLEITYTTFGKQNTQLDDIPYSDRDMPMDTPVYEISIRKQFLDENMKEIHQPKSPRVCQIIRFQKSIGKRESLIELGPTMQLSGANDFKIRVKEPGFFELKCYYSIDKPDWYKLFYDDVFHVMPKDMRILMKEHDRYIKMVEDSKRSVSDYSENPMLRDSHLEECMTKETQSEINQQKMNVLFLVTDSVAKNHFRRIMPVTYKYLTEELSDNIFYEKYNRIGENTYPIITPTLTGLHIDKAANEYNITEELSFYRNIDSTFHDNLPFIWNEFENIGYLTQFNEELAKFSMFSYKDRRGFRYPPVAIWNWPFYRKLEKIHDPVICYKNQPSYDKFFRDVKRFVVKMNSQPNTDTPYFSFNFMKYYTHDYLTVPEDYDIQFKNLIEYFESMNYLDNTLLVVMSDHGARLSSYAIMSDVGKMERSLPFISMRLPKRLLGTEFHKNAIANKDKLLTGHDFYKTLKQFYYFNKNLDTLDKPESPINSEKCRQNFSQSKRMIRQFRGISMFEKHPENRTCSDALIPMIYCTQYFQKKISSKEFSKITGTSQLSAAHFVTDHIVSLTKDFRSKCFEYKLLKVVSIKILYGFEQVLYVLTLLLQPGNALFEAYLTLDSQKRFGIFNRVIRMNKYGRTSDCMTSAIYLGFCQCRKKSSVS